MNLTRLLLFSLLCPALLQAGGFKDDFSSADFELRNALRGDWKFEEGVASCVADPDEYVKYKDHGPILRYPSEFTDGTISFEFKPKSCDRVVFTLNSSEGHVFRMGLSNGKRGKTRIFGWPGPSKETDPIVFVKEGMPDTTDLEGQWVKVVVKIEGSKAEVKIGDYTTTIEHEAIARAKGEVTLSFAFGELAVRNLVVDA